MWCLGYIKMSPYKNHIKTFHYFMYINAPFLQSMDKFTCTASRGHLFLVSLFSCYSIRKESVYFVIQFVDYWILKWVSTCVHERISLFHQSSQLWFMTLLLHRPGSVEMGKWTRLKHTVGVCGQEISLTLFSVDIKNARSFTTTAPMFSH